MQYRDQLKQRIKELEAEIANKEDHKDSLQRELRDLRVKEFEEDMREEDERQILLKG